MAWYWIVLITAVAFWTVGLIWAAIDEDTVFYWACGLLYPILYALFYPVRAWQEYSKSKNFYEKHGISRLGYMLGKRVRNGK